jgi:hypothetical protein
MPFANATQILIDGPRNTASKTTGDGTQNGALPTSVTILDPALLTGMNPGMAGASLATLLRLDFIEYSISDGITVQLIWDATAPVAITELSGRGKIDERQIGGLLNNAGAGVTGKILMTVVASDQVASAVTVAWTIILRTIKFRPISVGGA